MPLPPLFLAFLTTLPMASKPERRVMKENCDLVVQTNLAPSRQEEVQKRDGRNGDMES